MAGAAVSPQGDLYVATGNGSSDSISHFDEGNTLVELSPSLRRLGYYAPGNWVELNDDDWDLGSASPIDVPGANLMFVAGKPANNGTTGYLVHDGKLGGIGHGAYDGPACGNGGVFGADASDVVGTTVLLYTACQNGVEALRVHPTSPISFHEAWSPSTGSPNGPPVVAGGLVFSLDWNGNELYAMNPLTGHVVLVRGTDDLNHFATPGIGDGEVLIPTAGGVEAYAIH